MDKFKIEMESQTKILWQLYNDMQAIKAKYNH
jgi:hypothetical protein